MLRLAWTSASFCSHLCPSQDPQSGAQAPKPQIPQYILSANDHEAYNYNAVQSKLLGNDIWPFLDTCYAPNLLETYLLALPCPVRTLVLDDMGHWSTNMFKDVAERARPKELMIGLAYPEQLTDDLREGLECTKNSLGGLLRLFLCVSRSMRAPERTKDIFATLVRLTVSTASCMCRLTIAR